MKNYSTRKWEKKREAILKRDGYKCMECSRKNITTPATVVHHINTADRYPDLFFCKWEPYITM